MQPLSRVLLVLALLLPASAVAQRCEDMTGAEARALRAALDSLAAVGPVWSDYTVANHPIVFVSQSRDTSAPACAGVWRYRTPFVVVPMSRGIRLATPLWSMWNGDPIGPNPVAGNPAGSAASRPVPQELVASMRRDGDTRAVILPVPLRLDDLGNLGRAMRQMQIDPTLLLAQLAVHESYHLHSQFPRWYDQSRRYDWPAWDVQPDRRALIERCYAGSDSVKALHDREMAALVRAWQSLVGARDAATDARAIGDARAFIEARRARWRQIDTVTVPAPTGAMSCERAENTMELEEGAPQYMGYVTAVRAGLMRPESAGQSASEPFYVSGSLQLWILDRLLGEASMRQLSRELTQSSTPDEGSIFARFVAAIGQR